MIWIGVAGLLLFVGQSFVVLLMLVFITDCIEYGHWKLGRRNAAVTFALQPFINKVGAALATQIVSVVVDRVAASTPQPPGRRRTADGLLLMQDGDAGAAAGPDRRQLPDLPGEVPHRRGVLRPDRADLRERGQLTTDQGIGDEARDAIPEARSRRSPG